VLRWLLRLPTYLFRARLGFLLGHRFLLLVHVGRRTGAVHRTVLEVIHYDRASGEAVVLAGWGTGAQWLKNLETGHGREVQIGRDRFVPAYRVLPAEEAAADLAGYERRNRLIAPIVRRVLGMLVGWRYDGSAAARRRVVAQLPLVGFRPRPAA
jgi:deazaflavin-dependent oxidoreductase (nitroreductase family)